MLSNHSVEQGVAVAQMLGERDIGLRAKTDSPLAQLVALTKLGALSDTHEPTDHAMMLMNQPKSDEFAEGFAFARDGLARSVASHMSMAKNVVSPAVATLRNYVVSEVERVVNSTKLDYSVSPLEMPEPLHNDSLQTAIARQTSGTSLMPERQVKLKTLPVQEIYELMAPGSGEFDSSVRLWISTLGDEFFSNVYNSFFSEDAGLTPGSSWNWEQALGDYKTGPDAALAVYLLAQRLEAEVPEGVTIPLNDFKVILNEYRQAAVETLTRAILDNENSLKNGILVLEYNSRTKTIVVNGEVYRRWLETGGTPEILAGALISGNAGYTVAGIDESKAKYADLLSEHMTMLSVKRQSNSFDIFKRALREGYLSSMLQTTTEESDMVVSPGWRQNADDAFERELALLGPVDMEDVAGVCMRVLCRSRFYYTDAEFFLQSMINAAKAKPGIDAREAGLVAMIAYVSRGAAQWIEAV